MNRSPHTGREARQIYSVAQLNRTVRQVLEQDFGPLWIEGEISNLARPASGHWYFSLKDATAQVRCALFRNRRPGAGWTPKNGDQVLLWARVSLYEARGEYQLIAESIEPLGDGLLRRQLEQLKTRLQAEGLFDAARKRSLPGLPRRIGVITSPTGAAIRDVLQVLRRRAPFVPVVVYPTLVQGAEAAPQIIAALQRAAQRKECDVLLLVRGGGSLEDLWAFNDAALARAIATCPLPLVAGIGHEIDVTIADLVADLRAPTPSAAAEMVSPDREQLGADIEALRRRLQQHQQQRLARLQRELDRQRQRLQIQHPLRRLQQLQQHCDELDQRLRRELQRELQRSRQDLAQARRRLRAAAPTTRLPLLRAQLAEFGARLRNAQQSRLQQARHRLHGQMRALDGVSPLATLGRGYALLLRPETGAPVSDADEVSVGDRLDARLARGQLGLRVETTRATSE